MWPEASSTWPRRQLSGQVCGHHHWSDRVPHELAGHALLLKSSSVEQLEAILDEARRRMRT
jgi:hypothetical protein